MNTVITYTKDSIETTIVLPEDLNWKDEYEWTNIIQTTTYSFEGSLIVEEFEKKTGRTITLSGNEKRGWISKTILTQLETLTRIPDLIVQLHLSNGSTFTCRVVQSSLKATQIFEVFPHVDNDLFWFEISFFEYEE